MANYLTYATMEEAACENLKYLIPASFTMTDGKYGEHFISTGTCDNEVQEVGASATQYPKTYSISTRHANIRIIDTPGIGDTRGVEKDKENFQNIMAHIARFDVLHGICILLKPDVTRLGIMFKYCIKELLANLHVSASKNIVFCFTNARCTNYGPGDTRTGLKRILQDNNIEIGLNEETIFCVDNEAFRYLAATKQGVDFSEAKLSTSQSWKKSAKEISRMIQQFDTLEPHAVKNTLSINDVRRVLTAFSRPLTTVTTAIDTAIDMVLEELNRCTTGSEELPEPLTKPKLTAVAKVLESTPYVCTTNNCVRIEGSRDFLKETFKCRSDSKPDLKKNGTSCANCGCDLGYHKRLTYELQYEMTCNGGDQVEDQTKAIRASQVENVIKLEKMEAEFGKERQQIVDAREMFAGFLRTNAIVPHNDAFSEYVELTTAAESRPSDTDEKSRRRYAAMWIDGCSGESLTPYIRETIDDLYAMKHTGDMIRSIMNVADEAETRAMLSEEVRSIINNSSLKTSY